jgi:hypothetical protein
MSLLALNHYVMLIYENSGTKREETKWVCFFYR